MAAQKKYELTPEHEAQLEPWAQKWIKIAMNCDPMTDEDRAITKTAINGLYKAAKVEPPRNIVFVKSPLVGNIAAGLAAAILYQRSAGGKAMENFGDVFATIDQIEGAGKQTLWRETFNAVAQAIKSDTFVPNDKKAASAASAIATAVDGPMKKNENWMTHVVSNTFNNGDQRAVMEFVGSAWKLMNGGNHWAGWVSYITFFRYVAKLPIDYTNWDHYEKAAVHSSWRWMHPLFCIVSDRPLHLKSDHLNRPHALEGAAYEWRDGNKMYYWKGTRIPGYIIEQRKTIDPKKILAIQNAEHRRSAVEIYAATHGPEVLMDKLGAKLISEDVDHGRPRKMLEIAGQRYIHVINGSLEPDGTRREFLLGAAPRTTNPKEAVAASYGINNAQFKEAVRT